MIDNVLHAFDAIDPSKIIVKPKLHLLVHLPDDIRRFGPAVRYATEIFEAYNGIFRFCAILSNRQAVSHDVAMKFRSMDCMKHLLSGGFWEEDGCWIQAGKAVQMLLQQNPVLQHHLGWVPAITYTPGKHQSFWFMSLTNISILH